jgi:hypothetical protein
MKLGQFIIICLSVVAFLAPKKSEGQTISGVINSYYNATAIINNGTYNSYSYSGITLDDITGLSTGDRVLIIQMKGATIDQTSNNASFGNITSIGDAGKYEFSSICGFLNNTIVLSNHLLNLYDAALIQVVRVPVFENATVIGTLSAAPWDETTGLGGVLAIEVNNTLTLNANVNLNGTGFAGGQLVQFGNNCLSSTSYRYAVNSGTLSNFTNGAYKGQGLNITNVDYEGGKGKQSNGGGGGNNHNAGGGGGGNYGNGGIGGTQTGGSCNGANNGIGGVGLSGFGYSTSTNKIFLGGGGGSGHANNPEGTPGGNGGGIIYIKCNQLIGNSYTISSNGSQGVNNALAPNPVNASRGDGAGGGGAGGTVLMEVAEYSGDVIIEARGANGNNTGFQAQCPGPGGGGGGGIIWYNVAVPSLTNVSGGNAGTITSTSACNGGTNGATAGTPGIVQSGYVAPQGINTINCSILPLDLLKQFTGKKNNHFVQLNWTLTNADIVQKIVLERKTGNERFKQITEQLYPSSANGFYTDKEINSAVTYRLVLYGLNGERQYSNHIYFDAALPVKTISFYPNPASNDITIQLPVKVIGKTTIIVLDITGQQVLNQQLFISSSQNNLRIAVEKLPAGIYNIRLENKEEVYSAKLIKQ